jgi:hypothetical protein
MSKTFESDEVKKHNTGKFSIAGGRGDLMVTRVWRGMEEAVDARNGDRG